MKGINLTKIRKYLDSYWYSIPIVQKLFRELSKLVETHKNDPVKNCTVYRDKGCSHVDGPLCDFPNCILLKKYEKSKMD